jgi:hypothetical protein
VPRLILTRDLRSDKTRLNVTINVKNELAYMSCHGSQAEFVRPTCLKLLNKRRRLSSQKGMSGSLDWLSCAPNHDQLSDLADEADLRLF